MIMPIYFRQGVFRVGEGKPILLQELICLAIELSCLTSNHIISLFLRDHLLPFHSKILSFYEH